MSAEFRLSDEQREALLVSMRSVVSIYDPTAGPHFAAVESIVASEVEAAERALVERMTKVAVEMDARARAFSSTGIGDAYANATSFICSALDIDRAALAHVDTEGKSDA